MEMHQKHKNEHDCIVVIELIQHKKTNDKNNKSLKEDFQNIRH